MEQWRTESLEAEQTLSLLLWRLPGVDVVVHGVQRG